MAPSPNAIGTRLRAIRKRYGVSGLALAARLGCNQSWISKLESGKLRPSIDFIDRFASALAIPPSEREELQTLTELFLWELSHRHLDSAGEAERIQRRLAGIEDSAEHVRSLDWFVLSGLLQTEAYARGLFATFVEVSRSDAEAAIRRRMERQRILRKKRRRFTFLIAEHVFFVNCCSKHAMLDQLAHIEELGRLPNVAVRVVPMMRSLPVVPVGGFDIFDDRFVLIENRDADITVWEELAVRRHIRDFEDLERIATSTSSETSAELRRIERRIRASWSR